MAVKIEKISAKSALKKSQVKGVDYVLDPYSACTNGCRYCDTNSSGYGDMWGDAVNLIKVNCAEVLKRELPNAERGVVRISSHADPYQPAEGRYKITRNCMEALVPYQFPVELFTKSPLILRDIDVLSQLETLEVGITITTDSDLVRRAFEPQASPIAVRINILKALHEVGINTCVKIDPVLPMNPERLAEKVRLYTDKVIINYSNSVSNKTLRLYKELGYTQWADKNFVKDVLERLKESLQGLI
ncbi:SPL family radical SAM protein [Candidatus Magnetomonas plexicatena]|uniref:SPL family radical SAM protein n=1 Tax=Candidatus Magnetomonas plexicatena TaxID=2552947 RepID=UPI001C782444|nr:radical SAM protein [Nitrospirales bacterium LBB_01]